MNFDFESIFDSAVDEGFGPSEDLTPGKYRGSIVSANFGESQAGDPKAGFLFKAAEGSVSAEGHDVSGDTIWLNLTFSEKAQAFAARDMKKLGITGAMLNADSSAAVQTAVGQQWSFEVKLSKDGKWTNLYLGKRQDDPGSAQPKPTPAPAPAPAPAAEAAPEPAVEGGDPWDI